MTTAPNTASESSTDGGEGSLHYDVAAAYLAAGARVASWVIVSAIVFRWAEADYAMLGVVRYTILILNYTSLGLAPAMIRLLAEARAGGAGQSHLAFSPSPGTPGEGRGKGLRRRRHAGDGRKAPSLTLPRSTRGGDKRPQRAYAIAPGGGARLGDAVDSRAVYSNAMILAAGAAMLGVIVTAAFAHWWPIFLHAPAEPALAAEMPMVIGLMGIGTVLRLAGDAPGAWLQTHGRIGRDNVFLAIGEAAWVVLFLAIGEEVKSFGIVPASASYCAAAVAPLALRWASAAWSSGMVLPRMRTVRRRLMWFLLAAGGTVMLAQLADYLYAPIDYVLINHYLDPVADAAAYLPMAQIGSALLLVSSGLATVLLPRSAVAHAAGNFAAVQRYYVRGTLLSAAMLAAVAAVIWLILPTLLRVWLGKVIPQTVDVMPIMLLASVVGGSGMVGRSILIGTGKFGVFTASVLLAAGGNVLVSFLLVRYTGFGLAGVVLGTLVATVVRCVIWMPWYVYRMLRKPEVGGQSL